MCCPQLATLLARRRPAAPPAAARDADAGGRVGSRRPDAFPVTVRHRVRRRHGRRGAGPRRRAGAGADAETALALRRPAGRRAATGWASAAEGVGLVAGGPLRRGAGDHRDAASRATRRSPRCRAGPDPGHQARRPRRSATTLLSAIAPTVGQPEGVDPYLTSSAEQLEHDRRRAGQGATRPRTCRPQVDEAFADAACRAPGVRRAAGGRRCGAYTRRASAPTSDGDTRVDFMDGARLRQPAGDPGRWPARTSSCRSATSSCRCWTPTLTVSHSRSSSTRRTITARPAVVDAGPSVQPGTPWCSTTRR